MTSPPLSAAPAATLPAPSRAGPRWERWGLWLILAAFAGAGFNHVKTNTFIGQDFAVHAYATDELLKNPWRWFPQDFTNRPLIYWVGEAGHWLTHGTATYEVAAVICVLLATLALWFVHASTRSFIRSPWLRLSAVAFVAFLPATQVSTVVYAGDAAGPLPFALTLWCLVRCLEAGSTRAGAGYAVGAALALCLGNFARMPFVVLPAAGLVVIVLAWRCGRISGHRGLMLGALALVAPLVLGVWLHRRAVREFSYGPPHHEMDWHGTGEMTWRYLLLVKPSDARIFDAPAYWVLEHVEGGDQFALPLCHNYSYPALFHLAVYSDVLNYADDGELNNSTPRPEPQQAFSRWAVRLGVVTTVGIILSLLSLVIRSVRALFTRRGAPSTGAATWGWMALAWYLPLVLVLPFVHQAYLSGYWLPRLVLPALWGFGVVLFAEADQLLASRPRWLTVLLAGLILVQAVIHLRSVWF